MRGAVFCDTHCISSFHQIPRKIFFFNDALPTIINAIINHSDALSYSTQCTGRQLITEAVLMISVKCYCFRFCQECIITALRSGNKECPTCRKKLVSKRSLRPDPNFDALISKIYPCRDEYEAHQERVLARLRQSVNPSSMAENVEEGLRQQAVNRAQRVKKQIPDDGSQVQSGSVASDDGSQPKHLRLTESSPSHSEDQLATGSQVVEGSSFTAEIELVMRPHPQLSTEHCYNAQTRFIKTTSNATGRYCSRLSVFVFFVHFLLNLRVLYIVSSVLLPKENIPFISVSVSS